MKIKQSELNNLITEVVNNSEISKGVAFIIDKQGCDTDEAVTIYLKDNPESNEDSITQALTDFPLSNGMDKAFLEENVDGVINKMLSELEDDEFEEDEFEEDELATTIDEPELEEPIEDEPIEDDSLEKRVAGQETVEDLYGGEQTFNPDVQRALAIIHQVVREPREYYALLFGQTTPDGKAKYPGVLNMVVMNPREKRRAMRVILGKRLGDLVMDYLESESEGEHNEDR